MPTRKRDLRNWICSMATVAVVCFLLPASARSFDDKLSKTLMFGHDDGRYGQLKANLRLRYENVKEDDVPRDPANATTLRLRLGYLTPEANNLQGYIEYDGNLALQEQYNSGGNGKTQYSKVVDPQESELNQLWVSYNGLADTDITVGRQRILLDDQRFIGPVDWRQLDQTFDAAFAANSSIGNLTIRAGYIGRVQTVKSTLEKMNAPILNLSYEFKSIGLLTGYSYWLDYSDSIDVAKSNQTYGLRFNGSSKFNQNLTLLYTAEGSYQQDLGDNPNNYQADRYLLKGGLEASGVKAIIGYEQLQGKGAGKTFITPLGTNHAFQGWADKFLTTPDDGVSDVYGQLSTRLAGARLMFVYHNFSNDSGGTRYGDEYDLLVSKKFGKHYRLLAKYAYYDADQFSTDTQKFWLQAEANF